MAKSLSINASLVVTKDKITMWIKDGKKPVPLTNTPPLSILAVSPLNFALVGDAKSAVPRIHLSRRRHNAASHRSRTDGSSL